MATRRKQIPLRAIAELANAHWSIRESVLREMVSIANRDGVTGVINAMSPSMAPEDDDTPYLAIRNGVAIVSVRGPMFRYATWLNDVCGVASYDRIEQALRTAVDDGNVKGIVIDVDSPGGEVNGCKELSDYIYSARARKPVVAHVSGTCASAGYWIASACDSVVIGETAILGSIGCVCVYVDDREAMKNAGLKEYEIVSSQSPGKRPDIATKEGYAQVQVVIDALAQVFVDSVARNRGVTAEKVLKDFGQGGEFVGAAAITAGLADEIGTLDDVVDMLRGDDDDEMTGPKSTHSVLAKGKRAHSRARSSRKSKRSETRMARRLKLAASRRSCRRAVSAEEDDALPCADGETRCEGCDPENPNDGCMLAEDDVENENADDDVENENENAEDDVEDKSARSARGARRGSSSSASSERARIAGILNSPSARGREDLARHLAFAAEGYSVKAAVGILKASPLAHETPMSPLESRPTQNALDAAMSRQPRPVVTPGGTAKGEQQTEADRDVESARQLAASLFGKAVK